jgi:hypothetical protein
MTIVEEIFTALLSSTSEDLRFIRIYIGWIRFRKFVNNTLYPSGHAESEREYHWIGK